MKRLLKKSLLPVGFLLTIAAGAASVAQLSAPVAAWYANPWCGQGSYCYEDWECSQGPRQCWCDNGTCRE